jgi:hypothetical protein
MENTSASLPSEIGYEQITVCVGRMGTEGGYNLSWCDYIKTGGVGCKVCLRRMHFNNHESHRTGRKHTKQVDKLIADHRMRIETEPTTPKPVLWEIMFPEISRRQPMLSDDPDMKLDPLIQPKKVFQNFATAASDSQPTCASDPAGDLEPTDEDRTAWAASQATAEEEWRMSQAGPVEGRMGEYGGPRIHWREELENMVDEVKKTG